MQWSSGPQAGFSTAERTWLPVHPEYRTHNVEVSAKYDAWATRGLDSPPLRGHGCLSTQSTETHNVEMSTQYSGQAARWLGSPPLRGHGCLPIQSTKLIT